MSVASMESSESALRILFETGTLSGLDDGRLLELFRHGEADVMERAFAVLVERHGPMVLGVCEAVLRNRQDAEDAFQAVFLVLAQRSGTIRYGEALPNWLYGVARRISLRTRRTLARRRRLEAKRVAAERGPVAVDARTLCPELYEELDRLPAVFRAVVILCDLEGMSYGAAASQLGCPLGTLQSRLARGRQRLRARLERRGLGPDALASSVPIAGKVPPSLARQVVHAVGAVSAGGSARALASAVAVGLASAELRRAALGRLLAAVGTLGLAAAVVVGAMASRGRDGGPAVPPAPVVVENPLPKQAATGPIHVRVLDEKGNGVAGLAVEMVESGGDELIRTFTTDASGVIAIPREDLVQSRTLLARRGDESLAWLEMGSLGLAGDRAEGAKEAPIPTTLRPLSHRAEGIVEDSQGSPLAGVQVVARGLYLVDGGTSRDVYMRSVGNVTALPRAETDRAGKYSIRLPDGAMVQLALHHPRYVARDVSVIPGATRVMPTVMKAAGTIAGRVVDAETGRPVPAARVYAQVLEHADQIGGWVTALADGQGRFSLTGLYPAVYNLHVRSVPGRPEATARAVEGVRVRAGQSSAALIKIVEGRPLRGVVTNRATGKPLAGIPVGCYGPAWPQSGNAVQIQTTDSRGTFTFHVPAGENSVYLMAADAQPSRLSRRTVDVPGRGDIEPVKLVLVPAQRTGGGLAMKKAAVADEPENEDGEAEPGKAMDPKDGRPLAPVVPAPETRMITGRVRDAQGHPLPGVRVTWVHGQGTAPPTFLDDVVTDRDGTFVLAGLPRQAIQLSLSRARFDPQEMAVPADRDEPELTYQLAGDPASRPQTTPRGDAPVPKDMAGLLHFVDLSGKANDTIADGPGGSGNDLNALPRGIRDLGGQFFRVAEDMIHLAGSMALDKPNEVKGIPVGARGRTIRFLHGVQQGTDGGAEVGSYVVHYADGSSARIPIVYGRDVVNWWAWDRLGIEFPATPRAAWTGTNDMSERNQGLKVRLFAMTWTNPHPEKEIASFDITSAGGACDPFLVAVTVEEGP